MATKQKLAHPQLPVSFSHKKNTTLGIVQDISTAIMHSFPAYPAILALLVGEAFAETYCEGSFQSVIESAQLPKTGNRTKTVVVTVTQTSYVTEELPSSNTASHEDSSCYSGFAVPPLPDSVTRPSEESDYSSATGTAATINCPHPTQPCVINNTPLWPSGTTSLVLPSFTFDSLPTSMASDVLSQGGSMLMETLAISSRPTDLTNISNSAMPSSKESQSSLSGFSWPTRNATSSSDVVVMTSARTSGSAMVSPPAPERSSPSKTDAELSVPPTNSVHHLCKARPTHMPNAEAPVKRNVNSSLTDFSFLHPTNLGWTTRYIDTAVDSDKENNAPSTSIQKRAEESKARPRRMGYWSRFFAIAQPVVGNKCLACDYEGQVTCLLNRKYTWCKGGCVVVEKLGCDMVCEGDGQIRKEGMYCVR